MTASGFSREWALKWIEGSIISYMEGGTALNILVGRIRKAIDSYDVQKDDVFTIIDVIQNSPVYFPRLSREEKASRLQPLKEVLGRLQFDRI